MDTQQWLLVSLPAVIFIWLMWDLWAWREGKGTASQWIIKRGERSAWFAWFTLIIIFLIGLVLIHHWELIPIIIRHWNEG